MSVPFNSCMEVQDMRAYMVGLALLTFVAAAQVQAAQYPEKPVQFLVGWQIGDGTDLSARALCQFAEKNFPEPFVVVNTPGGSGGKAYVTIAQAKPDGYTIGTTTSSVATLKPLGLIDVDADDFEPIIAYSEDPTGLWVKYDAPWQTLGEFVEHARAHPGEVKVAASNPGSVTRFQMTALEQEAGIEFRVLSGGNAPGMLNVAGGHVDATFGTPPGGRALYANKQIRPLGFTSAQRLPFMPEAPTFKEQGFNVVMTTTRIVVAPKGTPKEVLDALYQAFKKATDDPEYRTGSENRGSTWLNWDPERCREEMKKQSEQFKALVGKVGMQKE